MWKTRKENLRIAILKRMIINECLKVIDTIKHMPNHTGEKVLGDYLIKIEPTTLLRK